MLERLDLSPPETILQISQDFAADPRSGKMDLGVGVYRDQNGKTPVLDAVKSAEIRIVESQTTKSYAGLLGNVPYNSAVSQLILGGSFRTDGHVALQTPGGSGALRLLFDLVKLSNVEAMVWVPDPTWANHRPVLARAGLNTQAYPYYDRQNGALRFDAMLDHLKKLGPSDVVLLHGCCHNPTGASLARAQWDAIAELVHTRGFIPLVDLAYQGFGNGLDEDAYGARSLYDAAEEMLLAYSCSKNFAIYRERTGLAMAVSKSADSRQRAIGQLKNLARTNHSMPPDHGAEVVRTILTDDDLTNIWRAELEAMRRRVAKLRLQLTDAFREVTGDGRFDFIGQQHGMFSLLGCSPDVVKRLRDDHAIYMAPDSRMNIAGLVETQVPAFVDAVSTTIKSALEAQN